MKRRLIALCTLALLAAAPIAVADKTQAEVRFDKGVELTKLDDFEGALVEFRAAYEAEPDYRVLYNIGICLYKLGRYMEALTELSGYLAEGGDGIPPDRLEEVDDILAEITSYIGSLEVKCDVDGAWILVDGKPMGETPLTAPLQVDVGEHTVEVNKKGYVTQTREVDIPGGMTVSIEVTLEKKGAMGLAEKKVLFKARATGIFIAGEVLSGLGLLLVPGTALLYFVDDTALTHYVVPSVGWLATGGLGVLAASHTRAAGNLAVLGIEEEKKTRALRIASWVFVGTTVAAEGLFYLFNGLFNLYDGKLADCGLDPCDSTRKTRKGFMIGSYLMVGALTGSIVLSLALSTAAWVLVGKRIQENAEASLPHPAVSVVPVLSPVEGGAVVGITGTF